MNACYHCGKTPIAKQIDGRVYLTCDCKMLPETERRLAQAEIVEAVSPQIHPEAWAFLAHLAIKYAPLYPEKLPAIAQIYFGIKQPAAQEQPASQPTV